VELRTVPTALPVSAKKKSTSATTKITSTIPKSPAHLLVVASDGIGFYEVEELIKSAIGTVTTVAAVVGPFL
jgi:hypothetical protein